MVKVDVFFYIWYGIIDVELFSILWDLIIDE